MREGYYVSVLNGPRKGLLLGPFGTQDAASRFVDTGARLAAQVDRDAHWYWYGTVRVRMTGKLPEGKLNHLFTGI